MYVLYIVYILYTHTHIYIHVTTLLTTHIYTDLYTYVKLFVICFKIPHTQIPHHVGISQLNPNKSQINGFHKMGNTRAGNLVKKSKKKCIKILLR